MQNRARIEALMQGGCGCGALRYRLLDTPLFVHCCHCTFCQRESGSAFAVNVLIETDKIEHLSGKILEVFVPTPSGKGQTFIRCPDCMISVWSHYGGATDKIAFVSGGTLDDPNEAPPSIHIYTSTKRDFVILPDSVPCKPGFYRRESYWPKASLDRRRAVIRR